MAREVARNKNANAKNGNRRSLVYTERSDSYREECNGTQMNLPTLEKYRKNISNTR